MEARLWLFLRPFPSAVHHRTLALARIDLARLFSKHLYESANPSASLLFSSRFLLRFDSPCSISRRLRPPSGKRETPTPPVGPQRQEGGGRGDWFRLLSPSAAWCEPHGHPLPGDLSSSILGPLLPKSISTAFHHPGDSLSVGASLPCGSTGDSREVLPYN